MDSLIVRYPFKWGDTYINNCPLSVDWDYQMGYLLEVVERESNFSTSLGEGVVVPHVYVKEVTTTLCAVGLVTEGVEDWPAPEGETIRLVFMLLGPVDDPDHHLIVLSEVVHMLMEPGMVERLCQAPNEVTLATLLGEAH